MCAHMVFIVVPIDTVCTEIFAVLNFRGFHEMPGHPRKFNLRIMVLTIKWPSVFDIQGTLQNTTTIEQRTIGFVLV